jgi:ABC-2 type transport system permease protein
MRNLWLVAKHEYKRVVTQKSFLLTTFGLPVLMLVVMGVSILAALGGRGDLPVGYVDHAGVLSDPVMPPSEDGETRITFQALNDRETAIEALKSKEVQAVYVLSNDYIERGHAELLYLNESPGEVVREDFEAFLIVNLLKDQPPAIRDRVLKGGQPTIQASDSNRTFSSDRILDFVVPFVATFVFIFAVMSSGGNLLQAITDEKENRTVEILTTSIRPEALMGGKSIGLMGVGLTQMLLWISTGVVVLFVISQVIPVLSGFSVPWTFLAIVAAFFIPAYALIAGIMTTIGSMVTDLRQGQQISGLINMFFTMPLFFVSLIMANPHSPFVIGLSIFPTTSFVTTMLRWAMASVPIWQLIVSWLILVGSAGFSMWLGGRVFRMGILRYGQRLSAKSLITAMRGSIQ